jgi:predicted RNA-binding protein with PIN domain
MARVVIPENAAIWGFNDPKPLKDFPAGRVKLRMRNDDFLTAFVKTSDGIRQFIVKDAGDFWVPAFEVAANKRIAPCRAQQSKEMISKISGLNGIT